MFALEPTEFIEDEPWRIDAKCADGTSALVDLFFSEQLDDILRAKAFCVECPVKDECLAAAVDRREPWGVWGGQLFANGKVLANKRRRGRPPKVARPEPVLEDLVLYVVLAIAIGYAGAKAGALFGLPDALGIAGGRTPTSPTTSLRPWRSWPCRCSPGPPPTAGSAACA